MQKKRLTSVKMASVVGPKFLFFKQMAFHLDIYLFSMVLEMHMFTTCFRASGSIFQDFC